MTTKVSILFDGGFFTKKFEEKNKKFPTAADVQAEVTSIMALMALKHTSDKIVLVAGDSDFIAPIKFVRKEGIQVYLYSMGHKVKARLIEHCDFKLT